LAINIIAGSATPSDARMMWNPSVNAIWLRAAVRLEARVSVATVSDRKMPGARRGHITRTG